MKTNILSEQLKLIREFQEKYPLSHVGGSLGLFLLGYDLKRTLGDLDLITPEFDIKNKLLEDFDETSDWNDFDYRYRRWVKDGGSVYIKFDISIDKEQKYTVVEYDGYKYNVSLFENIMKYKKEYADKGVFKHKADLVVIETGVRPVDLSDIFTKVVNEYTDDLPF